MKKIFLFSVLFLALGLAATLYFGQANLTDSPSEAVAQGQFGADYIGSEACAECHTENDLEENNACFVCHK